MKVFTVHNYGREVVESEIDFLETFEWQGSQVPAYTDIRRVEYSLLEVVENYGGGGVIRFFYTEKFAAEREASRQRQGRRKVLQMKIAELEAEIASLE